MMGNPHNIYYRAYTPPLELESKCLSLHALSNSQTARLGCLAVRQLLVKYHERPALILAELALLSLFHMSATHTRRASAARETTLAEKGEAALFAPVRVDGLTVVCGRACAVAVGLWVAVLVRVGEAEVATVALPDASSKRMVVLAAPIRQSPREVTSNGRSTAVSHVLVVYLMISENCVCMRACEHVCASEELTRIVRVVRESSWGSKLFSAALPYMWEN